MSTMDSAVEGAKDVLRLWQEYEKPNTSGAKTLAFDRYADAAILYGDEISRALLSSQSQAERMREALKPFAEIALARDSMPAAPDMIDGPDIAITAAHVRRARAALNPKE